MIYIARSTLEINKQGKCEQEKNKIKSQHPKIMTISQRKQLYSLAVSLAIYQKCIETTGRAESPSCTVSPKEQRCTQTADSQHQ